MRAEAVVRTVLPARVHLGNEKLVGAEAQSLASSGARPGPAGASCPWSTTSRHLGRIADWVLQTACRQAGPGSSRAILRVGINLSPSQLQSATSPAGGQVLAATGVTPQLIELEVTRYPAHRRATRARYLPASRSLACASCSTGTALRLELFEEIPLDGLQDRPSFVRDLLTDSDAAIVSSTISLGKQLGLAVGTEGIETGRRSARHHGLRGRRGISSASRCRSRPSKAVPRGNGGKVLESGHAA